MEQQLAMYFNTTGLEGEDLEGKKKKVSGQNIFILDFFQDRPEQYFTPWDVLKYLQRECYCHGVPVTSVRRGINTLTRQGYLVKTDIMKEGAYGSRNHTWKLA